MALALTEKWTLRNDIYYYYASTNLTVRSALPEKSTGKGQKSTVYQYIG